MAKDDAVRNQKVFVTLDSVLGLQERYLRVLSAIDVARQSNQQPSSAYVERKRTIEEVIDLLGLPINKQQVRS